MNPLDTATAEEALNLEPLTRFRFRTTMIVKDAGSDVKYIVKAGHRAPMEYYGEGPTVRDAIFNAGIDFEEKQEFTD